MISGSISSHSQDVVIYRECAGKTIFISKNVDHAAVGCTVGISLPKTGQSQCLDIIIILG